MSLRNRFVLPIIFSSLAILGACGGGGISHVIPPPPTGNFTNSDLNGTYVFSVTGSDSGFGFLTMVGTLTADGNGSYSGGKMDLNGPLVTAPVTNLPITGGSYSITADGRGQATLSAATPIATSVVVDFVLSSSSHGLITEFDSAGTGSGTIDLQSAVTQSQIAGSYAFNTTGVSVNSTGAQTSFAAVGAFTLDANGNVTTGVEDFNDDSTSVGLSNLAITGGSVSLATVPGLATLTTSEGTFTFDVYPIDSTHLKFIEIDSLPIMAGDAFTQSSSIPTGANVFTVAGLDFTVQGPFTAAGLIVTDGAGLVTSASAEDINDAGVAAKVTGFTGSYTAVTGGRAVLTLSNFANGNSGGTGNYQFAAYPSSGGVQLLEIDNVGVTAGVAYPQTSTTLASSGSYGFNLAGINSNGEEEDDIAQFTNNSGSFTGFIDFNDLGATSYGLSFASSYAADSTIPSRGVISPTNNAFNLVSYIVDSSTAVFVEVDSGQVGLGSFGLHASASKSYASAV